MKGYSIKHIATKGIVEREGEFSSTDGQYFTNLPADRSYPRFFERVGRDLFLTREEAVEAGLEKLKRAQVNLQKRAQKIHLKILALASGRS